MIRKATEGKVTWFSDLDPKDIPDALPTGIIIHLRGSEIGIEVHNLVGAIPLLNGDTLQIIPKIGQVNFFRLLFKAEGFQLSLAQEYNDFVEYSATDEETIEYIVARQLFFCAEEILKRSPMQGRILRRHEGSFVRGKLDTVTTAFNTARKRQEPIIYFIKERTLDILENRVITSAMIRAWLMLSSHVQAELETVYSRWLRSFEQSRNIGADLEVVDQRFASNQYGGVRDYYRKALMLSQIILGSQGLGFRDASIVQGDAVLINSADIFEKYVRNIIRQAYNDLGYIVTKGGVVTSTLYTDGSYELIPDVVISKDGLILLIIDAKYKIPDASDHYQMITYLSVNRVACGLIISPSFDSEIVLVREYATAEKRFVREVQLPLKNLKLTEDYLGSVIGRFAL